MNAHDVVESYVTDVAVQLPRKQRNDVAFELRELINEGLRDKAEAAGRAVDADLAIEFLRAFGRPEEVAERYRPALTIIDPEDGPAFLRATVVGLAIIWSLGLLLSLRQPMRAGWDLLNVLGQWWTGTVIPSLWWPGVLVVCFAVASWVRRRRPQASEWKPRASDRIVGSRAALVLALVGILFGLFVLLDPRWVLDVLLGGRAAPQVYEAFTYTETFRRSQAPWVFGLLVLNVPLLITVIVMGRWSPIVRQLETGLGLITCAVLVWTLVDGPVFMTPASDGTFKFFLGLVIVVTLISMGIKLHRSVKPAPNQPIQADH